MAALRHRMTPVAIFSLEMSKESLLMRLVASIAKMDAHKFRTGHLSTGKLAANDQGCLLNCPPRRIWIDDSGSATVTEIGAKARRLKRDRGGLSLVIVDYLQLIAGRGRFSNRNEEVSSITRGLKGLAKEAQGSRAGLRSQLTRTHPEREKSCAPACRSSRIGHAISWTGRRASVANVHSTGQTCSKKAKAMVQPPMKSAPKPI